MGKEPQLTQCELRRQDELVNAVYEAQVSRVYGYLLHRAGGERALAEELTQEVFLAFLGAVRGGTVIDDPQGWLITVARNHLVGHFRRLARRPSRRSVPAFVDDVTGLEAVQNAMDLLGVLSPDQRIAMVLRYVDDLSVSEVATAIGRSVAATESLLARARRAVKTNRPSTGAPEEAVNHD